jgi:hypothetical protein
MHLYVATKGIKHEVDQFITELQGKYLPLKYRDSVDKPFQDAYLQLAVRPIQIWEIGYPKEHHDIVCNSILGLYKDYPHGIMGNDGTKPVIHKWVNKFIFWARKLLHLDPIPEWKGEQMFPIRRVAVSTIGLGTKQDYTMPSGVEGI